MGRAKLCSTHAFDHRGHGPLNTLVRTYLLSTYHSTTQEMFDLDRDRPKFQKNLSDLWRAPLKTALLMKKNSNPELEPYVLLLFF